MGLIEQAAKRLEELRRAGVDVPVLATNSADPAQQGSGAVPATPERAVQAFGHATGPFRRRGTEPRHSVEETSASVVGPREARQSKRVAIDLAKLAADGFLVPTAPQTQLADEFRVIKRPLLANAQGKSAAPIHRGNSIMITSAMPGEGKTFTAINLAISIAMEVDATVLLVDADVSRPAIPARLGIEAERGLLDLLTHKGLDVSDVLMRTNIDRLSILPAGTPHSRATEILASEGMSRLVDELASRYPERLLIFDAPPLLPSTESRVLATHMGQVVVVVEADRTPQGSVTQALAAVESCPVVMTVLNKVTRSKLGSYYGYQSRYGYAR